MKDFMKDPKYWTQFDEDIKDLSIDKIVITSNLNDTSRIKNLLWDAVDIESSKCGVAFEWYYVYQFLCDGTDFKLNVKDTDTLDGLNEIVHDSKEVYNLCIIECKDGCVPAKDDFEKLSCLYEKYGTFYATVGNKNIDSKYRVNFLYK